jgi:hypothetical protein
MGLTTHWAVASRPTSPDIVPPTRLMGPLVRVSPHRLLGNFTRFLSMPANRLRLLQDLSHLPTMTHFCPLQLLETYRIFSAQDSE